MAFDWQSDTFHFPAYECHKRVKAQKIRLIYSASCVGLEPDGVSFSFKPEGKPTPCVGWYVVCYEDGHVSFSPPAAFEGGYKLVDGVALSAMRPAG